LKKAGLRLENQVSILDQLCYPFLKFTPFIEKVKDKWLDGYGDWACLENLTIWNLVLNQ
jgi:hypothetical protein